MYYHVSTNWSLIWSVSKALHNESRPISGTVPYATGSILPERVLAFDYAQYEINQPCLAKRLLLSYVRQSPVRLIPNLQLFSPKVDTFDLGDLLIEALEHNPYPLEPPCYGSWKKSLPYPRVDVMCYLRSDIHALLRFIWTFISLAKCPRTPSSLYCSDTDLIGSLEDLFSEVGTAASNNYTINRVENTQGHLLDATKKLFTAFWL